MEISELLAKLDGPSGDMNRLADALGRLSDIFNRTRTGIDTYAENEELVWAYLAFYMPTNQLKLHYLWQQLLPAYRIQLTQTPLEVVDFGCGPGTYGFALLEALGASTDIQLHLVDRSNRMLEKAAAIAKVAYPNASVTTGKNPPPKKNGRRLLLLGNVINETGPTKAQSVIDRLQPDDIWIIEPGTKPSFSQVLSVRQHLLLNGYQIQYPCPAKTNCPAVQQKDQWCHQMVKVKLDQMVARLGQKAKLDRSMMPMIGQVYTKAVTPLDPRPFLFRLRKETKGAFLWQLCVSDNQGPLRLQALEVPKRGLDKSAKRQLKEISSGAKIAPAAVTTLKDGTWRVTQPQMLLEQLKSVLRHHGNPTTEPVTGR